MPKTTISWTNHTWNPVTGCTKVSTGCKNCYAERLAETRLVKFYPEGFGKVTLHHKRIARPGFPKEPSMIFVNSMSDLFHEEVPLEFIQAIFQVIDDHPQHIFQALTKRHERLLLSNNLLWPDNLWMGVSVENQEVMGDRVACLVNVPSAIGWLSIEPLLGPVIIEGGYGLGTDGIDWVVVGGESGPGARPMHPDWARAIRDQCQEAGIPFHFKGWGEFAPENEIKGSPLILKRDCRLLSLNGDSLKIGLPVDLVELGYRQKEGDAIVFRVGKKKAGRLLDGREWNEYPQTGDVRWGHSYSPETAVGGRGGFSV